MAALLVGMILVGFAVFACFPPLAWWADVLAFLRGAAPVLALFVGVVALLIGVADLKDRREAKREEAAEAAREAEAAKGGDAKGS